MKARALGLFSALLLAADLSTAAESRTPYQRTVAEIMADQQTADLVAGPRQHPRARAAHRRDLAVNPASAFSPAFPPGEAAAPQPSPAAPQTIGVSFLGATAADTNAFPPDTMGAAGPTQFLVGVNGRIRTFAKSTGTADGVLNADMDTFFTSVRNGQPTSTPRVRYDRLSGRWIVTIVNFNVSFTNNRILVAVSNTGTLTNATVWTYFYFQHNLVSPAGDTDFFFDYNTLGVDANALLIGGNIFDATGVYTGTTVHVVRKSTVIAGGGGDLVPSGNVVAFRNLTGTPGGPGPYTPQGVDNLAAAAPTDSWIIGVDNAGFGTLMLRRITFIAPGTWPPTGISANLSLTVPATAIPLTVPHQGNVGGPDGELDAVDDRLFDANLRGSRIWTAHNIAVDSTGAGSGSGDRDGSRWYEIDVTGGTPTLQQAGTLFDTAVTDPRFYWIPSIMVSGQGHAALGVSASGATQRINAATAGRLASDVPGTLQSPLLFTASATSYNPAADPGPPRRWGDYSYTSLDPNDDMTMWTIQEYCDAVDSYGLRVAQLVAPPPATPASAAPGSVAAGLASVSVVITGTSTGGSGFFDPGAGYPSRLQASVSGAVVVNSVTYTSPTSITLDLNTVGAALGPRTVTATNPDGQSRTSTASILTIGVGGPAPTVTSVAPTSGDAAGGTAIVITGTDFVAGATATIGGVAATGVNVTSATTADATTPPLPPGTLNDVLLINPDTQGGTLAAGWLADFTDVPQADIFHDDVEKLIRNGVTAGCGAGAYCRNAAVTRAQMAVFLLKADLGAGYTPPACTGTVFTDVPCTGGIFDPWIEDLNGRGITGGCGGGNYCPNAAVTRAQMAPFLLKTLLGSAYNPPPCTGAVFLDVPCTGGIFDPWIEDLSAHLITAGCGGGNYCPGAPNTRGQMAVFLVKTFSLP
ncbi:MAG: S-layer homology domain-containing protein [Thermoanaerobaculia bacterium]